MRISLWIKWAIAEFRRRRMFRVVAVYLVVGWLVIQVSAATFEPMGLPSWGLKMVIVLVGLGFALACALAWTYDITSGGVERTMELAAPSQLVKPDPAESAALPEPSGAGVAPKASVAILPFTDLSVAKDQDYFCDGLAEEIINALTRVRGIHVTSRTSSFCFRDGATDAREIGRVLNVATILEGSVRQAGGRVRVTAQLIDGANGYHLWSETFDRELKDIFAIQEEIARSVASALHVSLKVTEALDLQRYAPHDMRAYEFYLRGRQQLDNAGHGSQQAAHMFRRAIELDADYAPAHAGLADALTEMIQYRIIPREEALADALAASQRALELAPKLAEARVAHAHALQLAEDMEAATAEFERALQLDPLSYEANFYFGRHCFAVGQFDRAIELFEAAHNARPDEFHALGLATTAAYSNNDPGRGRELAGRSLIAAQRHIDAFPDRARAYYFAGILQQRLGNIEAGRSLVESALSLQPHDWSTLYNAACFYALIGEDDHALELLERATDTGEGFRDWIERDDSFYRMASLPRFQALLARLD